jgi:hypothetical protein
LTLAIGSISASATLDAPATGAVAYTSDRTGGDQVVSDSADPCIFYFIPDSGEGVAAGKIWVAFECPKMLIDTSTGCGIRQGYAIFENCED